MLRNMNSENVKVNDVELLSSASDVLRRKGGNIAWDEMMQLDKKTIQNNIFVFHIEANNSFKENVSFKVNKVEERVVRNKDKQRNNYYKVVEIEDITGRFGKHTLRTSEITSVTTTSSFKNKLTEEYRKTLRNTERYTKELKTENKKLNKDLDEAKKIDLLHQQQAIRKQAELNEKFNNERQRADKEEERADRAENEVMVVKNELTVTKQKLDEALKYSIKELTINDFVAIGKLYMKKTLKMKTDEEFGKAVIEYFETKVKRENK